MYTPTPHDEALIRRDKYANDSPVDIRDDLARLSAGEPLAYIIGWLPFLGLRIYLDSHPLIPRPETEWWTEQLIQHLQERFGTEPFHLLDLCAGSGAIGLAVLAHLPNATVSFAELHAEHIEQIQTNLQRNGLGAARVHYYTGDLFTPLPQDSRFSIIVSNPPYIPQDRVLDNEVVAHEPHDALFSGQDGLESIRIIANTAPAFLNPSGELWIECDTTHAHEVAELLKKGAATRTVIHNDLYGRPRVVVGYYT